MDCDHTCLFVCLFVRSFAREGRKSSSLGVIFLNFAMKQIFAKTGVFGLCVFEEIMTLALSVFVFDLYRITETVQVCKDRIKVAIHHL